MRISTFIFMLLWWIILALTLLFMHQSLHAQGDDFSVTGKISCTDQECDEGYFQIAPTVMLAVKPGSEFHKYLRQQAGRKIEIRFTLGEEDQRMRD